MEYLILSVNTCYKHSSQLQKISIAARLDSGLLVFSRLPAILLLIHTPRSGSLPMYSQALLHPGYRSRLKRQHDISVFLALSQTMVESAYST